MRVWIEDHCLHCEASNFIDTGDPSDLSVGDVEGFACWKCKTNHEFDEDGDLSFSQEDQIDVGQNLRGSESPEAGE